MENILFGLFTIFAFGGSVAKYIHIRLRQHPLPIKKSINDEI